MTPRGIVIYSKKDTFGLSLAGRLLKPLEFLSVETEKGLFLS